jgi:hypothetical protein
MRSKPASITRWQQETITAWPGRSGTGAGRVHNVAACPGRAVGFFRTNSLDGLSSLSSIPVRNLLLIVVGMPLAATVIGWLVAGREPATLARQPME